MKALGRVFGALLLLLAAVLLVLLPFLAFLGAGFMTDSPAAAGTLAILTAVGVGLPVVRWGVRRFPFSRHPWLAAGAVLACLLAAASLAALLYWRPLPGVDVSMKVQPTGYWELPTGSRIAYIRVPARGQARPTPVIRLHGGPSIPDYVIEYDGRPNPRPLDRLAEDGFDVYYYDQIGCGNSARLANVREYTIRRHVADLEAIRRTLGAEQVVLVALSWGSTLAAQYCAAHPDRVAKVVFESPGHLRAGVCPDGQEERADRWQPPAERQQTIARLMRHPRVVYAALLLRVNPQLAARVVPEPELSAFVGLVFQAMGEEQTVCHPERMPLRVPWGMGAHAFLSIAAEYDRLADPRPALRTNPVPALVIRGACEWLKPEVARDYVETFPNARFVQIEQGGHLLYLEQPEEYLRLVRAFLLEPR